jgi:hypothetical protein
MPRWALNSSDLYNQLQRRARRELVYFQAGDRVALGRVSHFLTQGAPNSRNNVAIFLNFNFKQ